jgi:hypothetical protein
MHLRQMVEQRVGKVSNSEMQFAICNLNLEIEYKYKSIPTVMEMRNILVANIEFYRKRKNLIVKEETL